jgi:hypothetical protein
MGLARFTMQHKPPTSELDFIKLKQTLHKVWKYESKSQNMKKFRATTKNDCSKTPSNNGLDSFIDYGDGQPVFVHVDYFLEFLLKINCIQFWCTSCAKMLKFFTNRPEEQGSADLSLGTFFVSQILIQFR